MHRRRHRRAVAASVGGALVAGSWLALRRPAVQRMDVRVGDAIRRSGSPPLERLDRAVTRTTDLGSMYAVAGMAGVLAAVGRPHLATDVFGVGTLAWLVAQGSKTGVRRQRPYEADGVRRLIAPPTGSSYPSGHAAVWVAVTAVVAEQVRPAAAPLVRALGAYVPLTRVYVGVHYPTDVIGGAGLGLVLGSVWRMAVTAPGVSISEAVASRPPHPAQQRIASASSGDSRVIRLGRRGRPRCSPRAPAPDRAGRPAPIG